MPNVMTKVLEKIRKRERQKRFGDAALLTLKMEEGLISQGMQGETWKRQGSGFSRKKRAC